MEPGLAERINRHVLWTVNRIRITSAGIKVTLMLAARAVPDTAHHLIFITRRVSTPWRLTGGLVLVALVISPVGLLLAERDRHRQLRDDFLALHVTSAAETRFLQSQVLELLDQQSRLTDALLESGYTIQSGNHITVKVIATGYSSSIHETDDTPFTTASNTRTRLGVLALSRDLLKRYTPDAPFSFGDRVHINGVGEFIVEDSMNARWDNRADVWFPTREDALEFGVQEVYLTAVKDSPSPGDESDLSATTLFP